MIYKIHTFVDSMQIHWIKTTKVQVFFLEKEKKHQTALNL